MRLRPAEACIRIAIAAALAPGLPGAGAGSPNPFTQEAAARGISYLVSQGQEQLGCGVGFADLDGDGDADAVVLGRSDGRVGIYENDGTGHFVDRSAGSGIPLITAASGVTAADYDDDGDVDLHFSNWLASHRLMRNDGGFQFTDVTEAAGIASYGAGTGCGWADYNGDGWLDLYVSNRTGTEASPVQNHLFRNLGDRAFADVAPALGVTDGSAPTLLAAWFDFDRDADADLYLGTDHGYFGTWINRLYANVGGTFVDVTEASGTAAHLDCMGIAIGDYDGNGWPDLYLTNLPFGNLLLSNRGDGTFQDDTAAAGVASYVFAWAAVSFDFDNDTYEDIFVTGVGGPDRLYRNGPSWPFVEMALQMGVADGDPSYCAAAADIDADGDLDLLVSDLNRSIKLYVNHEGQTRRWAKFAVVGRGHNRFGVGTRVELLAGGRWQSREVFAGSNYKSQNELTLHFGLAGATIIDQIVVTWPGGTTRTLNNYPSNATWKLYPPERLGDPDGNGIDWRDMLRARQCHTGPGPGNIQPGCEAYDLDGDGDIDDADVAALGNIAIPRRVRR